MRLIRPISFAVTAAVAVAACADSELPTSPSATAITPAYSPLYSGLSRYTSFGFEPIIPSTGDAACLDRGSIVNDPTNEPFELPEGYEQFVIGRQSQLTTANAEVNFDMLTVNETGPQKGRYLFRTHEVSPFAALSVVDLQTGQNRLLVEREDWESFDGLVWTPWGTILMAEEEVVQSFRDPDYPNIERGLVYEFFPATGKVVARPAIGARSHEGLRFDKQGNLYGISESRGIQNAGQPGQSGAIFKFVPNRRGDLSSGKLYALKVESGREGLARWVKLDVDPVTFDSDAAAQAVGATGWDRPEDVTFGPSVRKSGKDVQVLYVAVTESSDRAVNSGLVLKIETYGDYANVSNYVLPGVNVDNEVTNPFATDAGTGFDDPDNLAMGPNGELYITEDDSPSDIWVATGSGPMAGKVELFARLRDCGAESTGVYFSPDGKTLFVNSQHAALNGGDDLTIAIRRKHGR